MFACAELIENDRTTFRINPARELQNSEASFATPSSS